MTDDVAECRGCRRELEGSPYWKGGGAYVPSTGRKPRIRAMGHFYGGWVCSASCNRRVFREMQSANVASSEDDRRMRDGDRYFEKV